MSVMFLLWQQAVNRRNGLNKKGGRKRTMRRVYLTWSYYTHVLKSEIYLLTCLLWEKLKWWFGLSFCKCMMLWFFRNIFHTDPLIERQKFREQLCRFGFAYLILGMYIFSMVLIELNAQLPELLMRTASLIQRSPGNRSFPPPYSQSKNSLRNALTCFLFSRYNKRLF